MPGLSFPNEIPAYRQARDKLLQAEIALRQQLAEVAAERARLPPGGKVPEDYKFKRLDADSNTQDVMLSE